MLENLFWLIIQNEKKKDFEWDDVLLTKKNDQITLQLALRKKQAETFQRVVLGHFKACY